MAGLTVTERVLMYTTQDCGKEYLSAIQECTEEQYAEIEPWAWARLQRRLHPPKQRKKAA